MSENCSVYPKFTQLHLFASELLLILSSKKDVSVEIICNQIENGKIVEYIKKQFGFKNMNSSIEYFKDIDSIMKRKYVYENEARNLSLEHSGIGYLIQLILDDFNANMCDMSNNGFNPDDYRL